jgi:hypothetical protein
MFMHRRTLFKLAGATFLLGSAGTLHFLVKKNKQLFWVQGSPQGKSYNFENAKDKKAPNQEGLISIFDLNANKFTEVEVNSTIHDFCQSPLDSNIIAGVSKWARGGLVFDLKQRKTLKDLYLPEEFAFFGHSFFHQEGHLFFASAHNYTEDKGYILVYSTKSWELKNKIISGGLHPHQIAQLSNGRLIIANAMSQTNSDSSNLVFVNENNLNIEETIEVPLASHLAVLPNEHIVCGSLHRGKGKNGLYDVWKEGKSFQVHDILKSKNVKGEPLSFVPYGKDEIYVGLEGPAGLVSYNSQTQNIRSVHHEFKHLNLSKKNDSII